TGALVFIVASGKLKGFALITVPLMLVTLRLGGGVLGSTSESGVLVKAPGAVLKLWHVKHSRRIFPSAVGISPPTWPRAALASIVMFDNLVATSRTEPPAPAPPHPGFVRFCPLLSHPAPDPLLPP